VTRARRYEFNKEVMREALRRSGGLCEASDPIYGLESGQRCNAPLSHGVEFDHYPLPATDRDSNALENCVACCPVCHRHKTSTYDVPMQAKNKRQADKHNGIRPPSRLRGAGFRPTPSQNTATRPIEKWSLLK
jgi:5-methylcytosine-specific restriction protein A